MKDERLKQPIIWVSFCHAKQKVEDEKEKINYCHGPRVNADINCGFLDLIVVVFDVLDS